jgi:hypothetical protein
VKELRIENSEFRIKMPIFGEICSGKHFRPFYIAALDLSAIALETEEQCGSDLTEVDYRKNSRDGFSSRASLLVEKSYFLAVDGVVDPVLRSSSSALSKQRFPHSQFSIPNS